MADFINPPKLVETAKFKLSEETRKLLYRLYGLAEEFIMTIMPMMRPRKVLR